MSTDLSGTGFGSSLPIAGSGGVLGSALGLSPLSGGNVLTSGSIGQVTALPRAGVGSFEENTSINFLLLGSLVMALYVAVGFILRRASGTKVAVENDGITGM